MHAFGNTGEQQVDWNEVSLHIPGWSNKDCRKRWVCCCNPSVKKGNWTVEEDYLLQVGVELHGMKWGHASQYVASRQPDRA